MQRRIIKCPCCEKTFHNNLNRLNGVRITCVDVIGQKEEDYCPVTGFSIPLEKERQEYIQRKLNEPIPKSEKILTSSDNEIQGNKFIFKNHCPLCNKDKQLKRISRTIIRCQTCTCDYDEDGYEWLPFIGSQSRVKLESIKEIEIYSKKSPQNKKD